MELFTDHPDMIGKHIVFFINPKMLYAPPPPPAVVFCSLLKISLGNRYLKIRDLFVADANMKKI